jgi:thiol:disulfide interchange protein DsbC
MTKMPFAAFLLACVAICALPSSAAWSKVSDKDLQKVQDKFRRTFPTTPVEEVRESEIPHLYEVYAASRLIYYAPDQNTVLFGELYSANGLSLTQAKLDARASKRIEHIDKSVALTVGDGPVELIAFVDADCPHCKHAHSWLAEQKFNNVKELLYFLPMRGRPGAEARVVQALCAPPELRAEALRQVFNPDPNSSAPMLQCPQAAEILRAQAKIAEEVGITATPTFFVKGQAITGFDKERLAALLTERKE